MHDLFTVFCIDYLIRNLKNLKIIIVISYDTLNMDRNDKIKSIFKKMAGYFKSLENFKKSLLFVISKV